MPAKKDPERLATLITRKERIFQRLQNIFDLIGSVSDSDTKEIFLLRASEAEELRNAFEKHIFMIFEIESQDDPETSLNNSALNSFDEMYFRIKLLSAKLQPNVHEVKDQLASVGSGIQPRLPKLELFTFDGNIEEFTTFYETFCSLVHDKPHISKIDKFHYLISCTKGSVLNIVKSLPITASNYDLVWKSLLDKYQDNRMLVGRYLDKMLNFTPLTKESSTHLNSFIETFEHSFRAIESLNIPDLSSYVLCHIALRAIDPISRKTFEQRLDQTSIPSFSQLMIFVHNQIKVLDHSASFSNNQNLQQNKKVTNHIESKSNKYEKANFKSFTSQTTRNKLSCLHCGDNHMLFRCDQFRKLSTQQRLNRVETLKLCKNCLKPNHTDSQCSSAFKCFICQLRHHTLLHVDSSVNSSGSATHMPAPPAPARTPHVELNHHASSASSCTYTVVLGTAVVHVTDAIGSQQPCRILIDSGAQSNFISVDCLQRLGLSTRKCPYNIYGLAGENVKTFGMTSCIVSPRHNESPKFFIDAIILPKITSDLPTAHIPVNIVENYDNLFLADPTFYQRSPIDIILSGDIFPHIYTGNKIFFNSNMPTALNSVFGYVITGRLAVPASSDGDVVASTTSLMSYTCDENILNETLKTFWEIESLPCEIPLDPLDQLAEKIYEKNHYRDDTGRYVSPILMNPEHEPLGESRAAAARRLLQVERRLARAPALRDQYARFMREYEALGHMELYEGAEASRYFVPHHCVLRPSSTSTPLRVVFDGSSKTSTNVSLNDILLTGRKLHQDIFKIISKFRLYDVCFSADVSKMYRAVLIRPEERIYQHILWRDSPSEPMRTYELKTNTYGLRSAPYVAVRTMHQLARDEQERFPDACQVLLQGFYVDDLLWSCQSELEACKLQDELMTLLGSGGFDLKKWASNCPNLLTRMQSDQVTAINFQDDTLSCSVKVLGLIWLPSCDSFSFNYNLTDDYFTKRSVLKLLASIFDPVGFISPCTFVAKCIMQDLWKLNLDWDESLPVELHNKWSRFITDLPALSKLRIERHVLIPNFKTAQLVAYCDASSLGYASCVYLRSVDSKGNVKVRLLASKSKVAPIKPISIPRLELMSAVLLSKLVKFVVQNINDFELSIIALSDSTVVLSWLQTPPHKLKLFVSNRVSQITEVVPPSCWHHVSSEHNAADVCSRGALPAQLVDKCTEWLHGPAWLTDSPNNWPTNIFYVKTTDVIPEMKSNTDTFSFNSCDKGFNNDLEETFNKISSFIKLQRVMAWCFRFLNNCKLKFPEKYFGPLKTLELKKSHDTIIRVIQSNHFSVEIKLLENNNYVPTMRKLAPFIDALGCLRVGGRIAHANLPFDAKHPILLPKKCHVTKTIIKHYHEFYMHTGPRTLQGILCKKYWIVGARCLIRSVLSKCLKCFKCRPLNLQPGMGTLPASRVNPDKVFNHVGCDIGGPFYVKESSRRNAKQYKAYLIIFVCFSTKLVHCEILTELSCDAFLASFDRFVSRRGLCSCLYSDCGKNFIAAAKHLKDVHAFLKSRISHETITDQLSLRKVEWRFNPPSAPSMGGLWEAGIKSAKYHLYRAVGDRALTYEEITTVFAKIEAVMNSRPLCTLSDDPTEFDILTPGHFVVGQSLLAVPEYNFEDVSLNRLSRWQSIQKITQSFWRRWSDDYLHTLQQRVKWFSSPTNIKVGDLVLIKSELTRSLNWPRGRVEAVHPGRDNVVRVVTVRTQSGVYKRPVNKLCPLPYAN
ncbi:uncharacterized protein [Choristoneura fumiferana]|uniref:uncharacterized protein n=1 Tax=Choristoneura fumiferana TaxID=7141 RepID=UPI003D15D54B